MLTKFSKVLCMVAAMLMLVPGEPLLAQEKGQVVVISPKVGEIIDRDERHFYGIFPASRDFHSAVILQRPDGSYVAEITEEYRGVRKVRTLPIDSLTLDRLRNRIDTFDQLSPAEKTEIRARYEGIREATTAEKAWIHYGHEGLRETLRVSPERREEGRVMVISPQVGETIDREERDRYWLFPGCQNFFCAAVLQLPDSHHVMEVTEEKKGVKQARTFAIDGQMMLQLREWLERPRSSETYYATSNPMILITGWQQQQMEGRLLGLEAHTVLLGSSRPWCQPMPTGIFIDDIQSITVKKSSQALKGIGYGVLIGGALGSLLGFAMGDDPPPSGWFDFSLTAEEKAGIGLFCGGLAGGLFGGVAGAQAGRDEQLDLSQMSPLEKIRIVMRLSGL